jgi:hypothetical protein
MNHQHFADVLHRLRSGASTDFREKPLALRAVRARGAYLDQLVTLQGTLDLMQHGRRQTGVTDEHDRLERMGEGAQLPSFVWRHWSRTEFAMMVGSF